MSASTGPSSKGEKGKSKYRSLDINNIYNNTRSESSETQQTKSQNFRRHGMQSLGKVPQRRPPANLPSLRSENSGNDPSISLIPPGVTGWGVKPGETQPQAQPVQTTQSPNPPQLNTSTSSVAPAVAAPPAPLPVTTQTTSPPSQINSSSNAVTSGSGSGLITSGDKTWSSVMSGGGGNSGGSGSEHGPSFLAHQSPQFQQEFPSLSGEPGAGLAHPPGGGYGPGPSLRPQTEGSWSQGGARPSQPPPPQSNISPQFKTVVPSFMCRNDGLPMFPDNIQMRSRSQPSNHSAENRMPGSSSQGCGNMRGGGGQFPTESEEMIPRPIIRDADLQKLEEAARDTSWAANDDIDYNEKLAFSDGESVGEDEKENKLRDKNKLSAKEERKDVDSEKNTREKPYTTERNPASWRSGYQDYRNAPRQHMQEFISSGRVDDDDIEEVWKEKRRQVHESKMAACEKAKQRKEEEEKKYEESRAKKVGNKDDSNEFHSSVNSASTLPEWEREKEDRLKCLDNFKQMTQNFNFQMDGRGNRERDRDRDIRRDRDSQFSNRYQQSKPPRFQNRQKESKNQSSLNSGGFESKWSNQSMLAAHFASGRHNQEMTPSDKEDDLRKDRIPDSNPDHRFRPSFRDDRNIDNKRNNYDGLEYSSNSYQQRREVEREKEPIKDYDSPLNEKDSVGEREAGKEWEGLKGDSDSRQFEDRLRKDKQTENLSSTKHNISDQFDVESEWKERPHRPESRDRPSRPDSRDSRASKESKNSRDDNRSLSNALDGDYSWNEPDFEKDKGPERLPLKEKREIPHRLREHVPGPITPEKMEAYEHKHSQSQAEKKDKEEKENESKVSKMVESDSGNAWIDPVQEKQLINPLLDSTKTSHLDSLKQDLSSKESEKLKDDSLDKRKDNRDRKDEKIGGRGGSRNRGNSRPSGYNSSSYSSSGGGPMRTNWNPRDQRPRRNSPRRLKNLNPSESDNSADEISVSTESGKEDKKSDKKSQRSSKLNSNWKSEKSSREDKSKDLKGIENDKSGKLEKKLGGQLQGASGELSKKGETGSEGFAPRGEPSRRGRGGGRGATRMNSLYGPPGSKPFSTSTTPIAPPLSQQHIDSQDKQFSPPQPGRKSDELGKREGDMKMNRGKGRPPKISPDTEECWEETTSEASDSSDMKKTNKQRIKSDKKSRGTIGDKRIVLNSTHLNGRPPKEDGKGDDSGNEQKISKDDIESASHSNNGFQEVKSKKMVREGRPTKEEVKMSRSKNKDKVVGIKNQQSKNYSREFVNNKPPRMQRLDTIRKHQLQQTDVSDMNKLNQSVSSIFQIRGNDMGCPPPPPHNAWNKPITAALKTASPIASPLTQITAANATITSDKSLDLVDLGQSGNSSQTSSPSAEKAITKLNREVEKGLLDGTTPPVTTIIFENTNYKRDSSSDMGLKSNRFQMKGPRTLDKGRDRKMEDDLNDTGHGMSLGSFKSDLQSADSKNQETIQVPMSFSKNEDNADMKLDFAFDSSDLSQLSDDKTNPVHVGQSSAADLNQKIASVKKVWDIPGMGGHVDESHSAASSFTQGFANDKSLDPPSHHTDHSDFNPPDSYSSPGQLVGSAGTYVVSTGAIMKADPVSGVNTMCKSSMFQVNAQPTQQVTVIPSAIGTHPGPLSTPPPLPGVLGYQTAAYSSNLSAVPSPPNVMFNSQQPTHQGPGELYTSYPLNTAQVNMHGSGNRSYNDCLQSYGLSQNSTFQASMYMPQSAGPPNAQSVFQNPTSQYRPHTSTLSQQMSSNPSSVLMSSSSNSIVSGSQVKSSQPAIGTKSGGSAPTPTPTFQHPSPIFLIEPPMGFIHGSQFLPPQRATMQHSSSFYTNPGVTMAAAGSQPPGGLFNSSILSGGNVGPLQSASQFGVGGFNTGNQTGAQPTSAPPNQPTQLPTQPYPSQMGGNYRNQGYSKGVQHPGDSAKSPSQEFPSMFTQGGGIGCTGKMRVANSKPQQSASPQPQQHKFTSYTSNPHSVVSQPNLVYQTGGVQQSGGNSGGSRNAGMGMAGMRTGGNSAAMGANGAQRYVTPIQRPMGSGGAAYQQQMLQRQQQQQQHRMRQPGPMNKQYFHQQGGMKLEGESKSEPEESAKVSQDKPIKDDPPTDQ